MSEPAEPLPLGSQTSLHDFAWRLHQTAPDSPLPRDGEPYPDNEFHRRNTWARPPKDRRTEGADIAVILDRYFADADASPEQLATAFHDVHVPIHRNDHIVAAALRADRRRVRETGGWLVRHSTNRYAAVVGLALLATDWDEEDIPLIKTIGLLSKTFGPLAAAALQRRTGGSEGLLWLAQRVTGWGRVYVVEALCENPYRDTRAWLLRYACDGDFLNGYFAGKVATAAHLHEAITSTRTDDDLVDHAGRVLLTMADCAGIGMTLEHYPPAAVVLRRHSELLEAQVPAAARYLTAAMLAHVLATKEPHRLGCTVEQRDKVLAQYLTVLNSTRWAQAIRAGFDSGNQYHAWIARKVAPNLPLTEFPRLEVDHSD